MVDIAWSEVSYGIIITILVLGVYFIWRTIKEIRTGFPLEDERTEIIKGKAAIYAFNIGSYFMLAIMLGNIVNIEFLGVPLLDGWYALVISILVQNLLFILFRFYINNKGDF